MGYKIKWIYPDGDTEIDDEVYESKSDAIDAAEDGVLGFSTGADILDDMGEGYVSGELEYKILKGLRSAMFGIVRKTRSDCTVGTYEKKYGLPKGTIRNPDGKKARKDKTLKSLRKQSGEEYR